VKQGDPITISFQRHYETPPRTTEELRGCTINDRQTISTLPFEDDLILVADTMEKHIC
jgi:hypothetical protein